MHVQVDRLSPVLVELTVNVPKGDVKKELDGAYASLQKSARIKGFRPGKAPRDVIAHLYAGRVQADVAQRLVQTTLDAALAQGNVQPLSQPDTRSSEVRPDADFQYKARFEVRPEIEKVAWEGLKAKRPSVAVTDAMIDAELAAIRRNHSTLQAPEPARPAEKGDHVTLKFTLRVDGQVFGAADQEIETELGSGQIFAEIEQALLGAKPGEAREAEITFSDRHQTEGLRGKTGKFELTLVDLKERIYPSIDDELAKDEGEESLEKLKAKVKERIEAELKEKASTAVAEQLVVELCRANPIAVPPSLVEQQARVTEDEVRQQARRMRGGQPGPITPEVRAQIRADAEMKVRAGLVMAEIARVKEVKVEAGDVEKAYEDLAKQTGKNVARVKAEYRDAQKQQLLQGMILEDKILDLVEAAAAIEEG